MNVEGLEAIVQPAWFGISKSPFVRSWVAHGAGLDEVELLLIDELMLDHDMSELVGEAISEEDVELDLMLDVMMLDSKL